MAEQNPISLSPAGNRLSNASAFHNPSNFTHAGNGVSNTSAIQNEFGFAHASNGPASVSALQNPLIFTHAANTLSNTSAIQNPFDLAHTGNGLSNPSSVRNRVSIAHAGNNLSDASAVQDSSPSPAVNNALPPIDPSTPTRRIPFLPLYQLANAGAAAQNNTAASSPNILVPVIDRYALSSLVRQLTNCSPPHSPITPTKNVFAPPGQGSLLMQATPLQLSPLGQDQLLAQSDPDRTISNHGWMDDEELKSSCAARRVRRKRANTHRLESTPVTDFELDSATKDFASKRGSNKRTHSYGTRSNKKKQVTIPRKRARSVSPTPSISSDRSKRVFYEPAYKGRYKDYIPDPERMTPPRSNKEPKCINPIGAIPYIPFNRVKASSTPAAFPTKDRTLEPPPYTEPDAPTSRPSRDDLADIRGSYQADGLGQLRASGIYTFHGNAFTPAGEAIHTLSHAALTRALAATDGSEDGSFAALHPILANLMVTELLGVRLGAHTLTVSQVGGVLQVGSWQLQRTAAAARAARNALASLPAREQVVAAVEWLRAGGLPESLVSVYTENYDL